jgi:hypothetical protein
MASIFKSFQTGGSVREAAKKVIPWNVRYVVTGGSGLKSGTLPLSTPTASLPAMITRAAYSPYSTKNPNRVSNVNQSNSGAINSNEIKGVTQDLSNLFSPISLTTGGGSGGLTSQERSYYDLLGNQATQNADALGGYLDTQGNFNQQLMDLISGKRSDIVNQTQEQIDLLSGQKSTLEDIAKSGYEAQMSGLNAQKGDIQNSYTEALNSLNAQQNKQGTQLENMLTSRGASQSSYGDLQRSELSNRFAESLSSLTKQQTQELGRIDTALNTLESQAKSAAQQVDVNIQNTLMQLQQARDNDLKALEQKSIEQLANFETQKFDLTQQMKSITDQRDSMMAQTIAEASKVTGGSSNITNLASQLQLGNITSMDQLVNKFKSVKNSPFANSYKGFLQNNFPELVGIFDQSGDGEDNLYPTTNK